jgi:hypothetical protein
MGPVRAVGAAAVSGGARAVRRGGGFGLPAEVATASLAAAAPSAPLGGLLALQEDAAPEPAEARARRRAGAALRELAGLQLELLGGNADPDRLARLQRLAEAEAEDAEPGLAALLQEVALRARVELARRRARRGLSPI